MRPFTTLLPFVEARKLVGNHVTTIDRTERVALDDAVGRVLAENFIATLDIPPFNRAAMDGFAVQADTTTGTSQSNPKTLKIIGNLHAGDNATKRVATGECLQISTGAMMPPGADAVVMVEDTDPDDGFVKILKPVTPGVNVGTQGEDILKGTTILKSGTFLDPGKIGVLASHGLLEVKVYQKPTVAIVPTGEEVIPAGKKLKLGQLYDINSHTISALVKDNGCVPVHIGISGDSIEQLKRTIREALKNDIVVLSGGSSVGERDLLVDVIHGWGEIFFHGVKIKPGKPTMFGIIEGKPVLGMPGFPTSCLFNSYLFLLPAVRKMAHLPLRRDINIQAKLSRTVKGTKDRPQFLTVKILGNEAVPVFTESGAITSIANADGYIEIPENVSIEKGTAVTVTLF
jgi:molybdopterin molybdotransferase